MISRADQTKKYAIKIANNEKQKPPRTEADWEKILREVRQNEILSSNSHPNIVQFYKAWTDNVNFFNFATKFAFYCLICSN